MTTETQAPLNTQGPQCAMLTLPLSLKLVLPLCLGILRFDVCLGIMKGCKIKARQIQKKASQSTLTKRVLL